MICISNKGPFYVITGDIISSRRVLKKPELLMESLVKINNRYNDSLVASFNLFRGDELQGVMGMPVDLAGVIRYLRFICQPLKLRLGVGIGSVETGLDEEYSWRMDGVAFRHARTALEQIKDCRGPATRFEGDLGDLRPVNVIYRLIDTIIENWTAKQWQAVDVYETVGTFEKAGEILNITPQNVFKRCRAASWKAVAEGEMFVNQYLKERL